MAETQTQSYTMAEKPASNDCKNNKLLNLDDLDPKVRSSVENLLEIQRKHEKLDAKFREEKAALLAQHRSLIEPLYSQRYRIVHYEGVPEFWLNAMKNNAVLSEEITDRDEEALISLKEIKCTRVSGEHDEGFKLEFFFYSNSYFENSVLTKTYHLTCEHDNYEGPVLESAVGTEIKWCQGKCLTQRMRMVRRNGKEAVSKTEDCDSFFNFFKTLQVPKDGDEELDEDEAGEVQEKLEQDYNMAATIRDKIVPHALSWFTGEAAIWARTDWPEDDDKEEDANEVEEEEEEEGSDSDADEVVKNMESDDEGSQLQQCERPPECIQQ